jgi:hypothetical protein
LAAESALLSGFRLTRRAALDIVPRNFWIEGRENAQYYYRT